MIDKSHICVDFTSANKRQLLQDLSERAAKFAKLDNIAIFEALLERENLGSTGFGGGTAVPHARIAKMDKPITVFAKVEKPVDFNSVDGKPVDLVFLLLSPEGSGSDHLNALANISKILKDEETCNKLRKADNSEKIFDILNSK